MVSLKELKEDLHAWTDLASRGTPVQVTRYNKPYIMLIAVAATEVRVGSLVGKSPLSAITKSATDGKFIQSLDDDRDAS